MKKLLAVLLGCIAFAANAQKLPDMGLYKIYVSETDRDIRAEINPVESGPNVQTDRSYYWYSSGKIKITQGGYSGKLLNGQYNEFYLNKNLKEQGEFKKGLKSGLWKSWTENGKLVQAINWKNGVKNGGFESYDEKGDLKQKGNYANDVLDGRQITYYRRDSVQVVNYKDGKPVPKASSFWHKLNILKKNR
jgi:antitoxin component YwqK of YwqJK toxin-antitoxin module